MSNHGRTGSVRDKHAIFANIILQPPHPTPANLRPDAADVRIRRDRAQSCRLPQKTTSDESKRRSEDLTGSLRTPPPVAPKPNDRFRTPVARGVNISPSSKVSESKHDSSAVHVSRLRSPQAQAAIPEIRETLSESPGPQKKTSSRVEVGATPVRPPKPGSNYTTPPDNASCESESGRIVSPPPVGPKPKAQLRRTQPKPERTLSPPSGQETSVRSTRPQRALSDSAVGTRRPPVSPKPSKVSHDQPTVTHKKRLSHQYQPPEADTHRGWKQRSQGFKAKHKLDEFFEKIKPSALKAKWLKGEMLLSRVEVR